MNTATAISYGKDAIEQARDFIADVGGVDTARRLIDLIEQEQAKVPVIVKPEAMPETQDIAQQIAMLRAENESLIGEVRPPAKPSPKLSKKASKRAKKQATATANAERPAPKLTLVGLNWTFDAESFDWVSGEHRLADVNGRIVLRGTDKAFASFKDGKTYVAGLTAKPATDTAPELPLAETPGISAPTPKQPAMPKPAPKIPAEKPIKTTQQTVGQETQGEAMPSRKHTGKGKVETDEIINLIYRAREYGQVDITVQLRHILDVLEPGLGEKFAA
jgi:hypothetical protein